jgi:hypothetical protein
LKGYIHVVKKTSIGFNFSITNQCCFIKLIVM